MHLPSLAALRLERAARALPPASDPTLETILQRRQLYPQFQPVVDIATRSIYGFESLIRGPADTPLHGADNLLIEARRLNLHLETEIAAAGAGMARHLEQHGSGYLFLNFSARALLDAWQRWGDGMADHLFSGRGIDPSRLVIELTEQDPVAAHFDALSAVFTILRRHGTRVALDDYGVGNSGLQLWAVVDPDLVKVDRYFFQGIASDDRRQKLVRAIIAVSQCMGTPLVAEGVENAEDFDCICALGIRYAQGWYLGRPQPELMTRLPESVLTARAAPLSPVLPARAGDGTAASLRVQAPSLHRSLSNDDVQKFFHEHKSLHAVVVIDEDNRPVGIINRRDFSERYAQRYTRELFGRDRCTTFMNTEPVLVDVGVSIDQLSHVLISKDQRYLLDGFVITREGRYDSLGTGEALVRSVTEMRMEAARYANPLTSLPGNIPISQNIGALLEQGKEFVVCYGDLNNFKPFNDVYGYWRGDDMIMLCADAHRIHCNPQRDFVGHVGGDDFVMLFRSDDWLERTQQIISDFNSRAVALYDEPALRRSGIEAEDRYGVPRFFPFVTLSIGALLVDPALCGRIRPEDVASAAAKVKHKVKHGNLSLVVERYVDLMRSETETGDGGLQL
jgi:diguanylate cyclase (GGDEF)-like protein